MNIDEAVKAMHDKKSIEIGITEQVCTIFDREGTAYVKLVGLDQLHFAQEGKEREEVTTMSLIQFRGLHGKREDLKLASST